MPAYRLEMAKTAQAGCNGKKPCKGSKIRKGELRIGTWVTIMERGAFKWRHWGCTTPEVFVNMKKDFQDASELDGFDEIPTIYQQKVTEAWDAGHVADDDIPESARLPPEEPAAEGAETEANSSPVKKKITPKKKTKGDMDGEVDGDKPRKPRAKKVKKPESEEDEEGMRSTPEAKPKKARKKAATSDVKKEAGKIDEERPGKKPKHVGADESVARVKPARNRKPRSGVKAEE